MSSKVDASGASAQQAAGGSPEAAGSEPSTRELVLSHNAQASKLAHDLRNGLAGVRAVVQIVRDRLPEGSDSALLGQAMARLDEVDATLRRVLASAKNDTSWTYST